MLYFTCPSPWRRLASTLMIVATVTALTACPDMPDDDAAATVTPAVTDDNDGDGFDPADDCDDDNPDTYPGAVEIPYDGIDQDCDGSDLTDVDQDGHDASDAEGDDCDDDDPTVYLGADEIADGKDNDCDGEVDEGLELDDDEDGFGTDDDCNDDDPNTYPGAEEIPYDGIDQDCDGSDLTDVDQDGHDAEEVGGNDCDDTDPTINPDMEEIPYDGIDQDCDGSDLDDLDDDGFPGGDDGDDCDDADPVTYPGATEICDGKDNDCDGEIDEGAIDTQTFYGDADHDQYGDPFNQVDQCYPTGDLVDNDGDCNDADPYINPAANEICDQLDNDCDGEIDEGVTTTFYPDADKDGYGNPDVSSDACSAPEGYTANGADCDDTNPFIHPGATEVCDPMDIDENCNGLADDDDPSTDESTKTHFYPDADRDAYGDMTNAGLLACNDPSTSFVTFQTNNLDCDDTNSTIHPNAQETCNGMDDDCDGKIDEGVGTTTYFRDFDGDGYGDESNTTTACFDPPAGYVSNDFDCDDADENIHPGADEICNDIDDDCDGLIDEGAGEIYYLDDDGDGYGTPDDTVQACTQPKYYVTNFGDCDDTRKDVNPGAVEVCDDNDTDEDCDGYPDDADPEGAQADTLDPFYPDADRDGYGDEAAQPEYRCDPPTSTPGEYWSGNQEDCDDLDPSINPDGVEVLNLKDDDCDGLIDEGLYKPDCAWILAADPTATSGTYFIDPDGDFTGVDPFEVYCDMAIAGGGWTLAAKLTNQDDKYWVGSAQAWTGDDDFGDARTLSSGSDAKSQAWGTVQATEMMLTDLDSYTDQLYVATTSDCIDSMTLSDFFDVALSGYPNTSTLGEYKTCDVDHNYVPNWATEPNIGYPSTSNKITLNAPTPYLRIAATRFNDTSAVISFYVEYAGDADLGLAPTESPGFGTSPAYQDIGGPSNCYESDSFCKTYYPETVLFFVR